MTNGPAQEQPKPATLAQTKGAPAKPKPAAGSPSPMIYIGPTLPPALAPLPQYICFAGGIPPQLDAVFKQCPAIRELIIPTSELARARLAMAKPGTREHSFSIAVQKFITAPPSPPTEE